MKGLTNKLLLLFTDAELNDMSTLSNNIYIGGLLVILCLVVMCILALLYLIIKVCIKIGKEEDIQFQKEYVNKLYGLLALLAFFIIGLVIMIIYIFYKLNS